jgi:hypothetical protein
MATELGNRGYVPPEADRRPTELGGGTGIASLRDLRFGGPGAEYDARTAPTEVRTPSVASTVFEASEVRKRGGLTEVPDIARSEAREIEKQERGCVVRGLQSALGAEAAEAEWQQRFNQFGDEGPYAGFEERHPNLTDKQKEWLRGQKIAYADAQVANLIRDYRHHDSELGSALRDREVEEYGRQDAAGISQLIDAGRDVTIIGRVEGGGRHMVHITKDEHGGFVATSDSGQKVDLTGEYTTIAFAAKGEKPVELPDRPRTPMNKLPHLNETMTYKKAA